MMKHAPIKLIYHSMHRRPMPGCLPLFFILALLVVVGVMLLVEVKLPEPLHPKGQGNVYYRNDELLRFQVRQRSALPLRLPAYADPAMQLPMPEHKLPLYHELNPESAPAQSFSTRAPDSAVLESDRLLAMPPPSEPKEEQP